MLQSLKKIEPKNLFMLTLSGIISAIGVTCFLAPVALYDSGISGTSMLLGQLTPPYLTLSFFLLVLNIPLLLYGLKRQGLRFTMYAIYAVVIYSFSAWIINHVLPIQIGNASPLAGTDLLLCAIFGGIICGTGSGMSVRYGGAIDGIEVMAVIFAKRIGLTVGTFIMIYNVILYIICGILAKNWTLSLYSIVTYMAALKTIDFIVEGIDRAKCAMIVTEKPEDICRILSNAFETGSTKVEAAGGYSGQKKHIVYFVINRFQVTKMRELVQRTDPTAFITISEIADVFRANIDEQE